MNLISASTLRNTQVINVQNEGLGTIEDLMIDPQNGRVTYAVLDFGGFLGIGNKLFAVPLEAFRVDPSIDTVILDVTKDTLQNAPGFDKDNWPRTADATFTESVYDFYGKREVYLRTRTTEPSMVN